jgi:transcription elongation factor Elf1
MRDDHYIICPYCGEKHEATTEDTTDKTLEIECNECRKPFKMRCDFWVTYVTSPIP